MRVMFDSDSLPAHLGAAQRARAWAEAMEELGSGLDVSSHNGRFSARLTGVVLGDTLVSTADATSLKVTRTRSHIQRDGDDRLQLLFRGGPDAIVGKQKGRDITLLPGHAILIDHGNTSCTGAINGGSATSIMLPRKLLGRSVTTLENALLCPFDTAIGPLALLRNYAMSIISSPYEITPELARLAATHIVDLAILGFGGAREERQIAERRGLMAARLRAVLDTIAARCTEPDFSADDVGTALGISERYVQHLLAEDGRSFTEELTTQRLELAKRLLSDPARPDGSVTDIALACGFADQSTFYRRFRAHFGCTPTELRARTLGRG